MFSRLIRALLLMIMVLAPAAALAQAASAQPGRAGAPGSGQAYPNKPVRLIVPFSPGGTNDILARMAATHLSQALGENVIVDNRVGAEGIIGTDIAVKARKYPHQ